MKPSSYCALPLALLLASAACGASPPPTRAPDVAAAARPPAPSAIAQPSVEVSGALVAPMPVAVTSFGAAVRGEQIFALGGYFGPPHRYSREGQSGTLYALSGEGEWEAVSELESAVQGLALVEHDGSLCAFGGNEIRNRASEPTDMRSVAQARCYDPVASAWSPLPPLPVGRSSHEAAVLAGRVYLAGGWRLEGGPENAQWAQSVLALPLDGGQWEEIEAPFQRRAVGVAAAGEHLVVIGGLTPERQVSTRVDVYEPQSGSWTRGPDFPDDAFGVAAVGRGNVVYASGRSGVVYRWTVGEAQWSELGRLLFGRFFHQLVVVGEELVALGGISGMHTFGRTRHVERLPLHGAGAVVSTFSLPNPGTARNRQGVLSNGDLLYLFGGNNSLGQHDFEPSNFLDEGWRFHLPSLRWERVSEYPAARQTMQTARLGEEGISVGGFGHDGTAAVTHPETYAFNFESEAWQPRPPLARGRTQFGLATHAERLWIFGGLNYDPSRQGAEAFDHVTTVLASGSDGSFTEVEGVSLPEPRRAFAGAVLGDRYYLVGGMQAGFELVDTCRSFSFATNTFDEMPCPSRPRLSGKLIAFDNALYLVGGSVRGDAGMESASSVERFDPSTETWTTVIESLDFATRHAHVLRYRDALLLVSTHNEEGMARFALVRTPEPSPE